MRAKIKKKLHINTAIIRSQLKNERRRKFSPPPGFEPWFPGTESQCFTNEHQFKADFSAQKFSSLNFVFKYFNPYKLVEYWCSNYSVLDACFNQNQACFGVKPRERIKAKFSLLQSASF